MKGPQRQVGAKPSTSAPARSPSASPVRFWRWGTAAFFLVAFGAAIGYFLPQSVRLRDAGSPTGDFLTGTRGQDERANSRDLPALLAEGRRAWEAQDFRRAMDMFARALEMDPDQPTAHTYLGLILHRAGHPDRALRAFERALARDPTAPEALWGKGLVLYESLGRTAEAIRTWEALLAKEIHSLAPLGVPLHPVQLYEFALDLVLFGVLWALRRRTSFQGQIFLFYVAGYSVIRLVTEVFRGDRVEVAFGLSLLQAASVALLAMALLAFGRQLSAGRPPDEPSRRPSA